MLAPAGLATAAGPQAGSPYQVSWPPGIVTVTIVAAVGEWPTAQEPVP